MKFSFKSEKMSKFYKYGFTLPEILITLGIIGVIAAMVIPSLVQDIQDQQLKVAFKKLFSPGSGYKTAFDRLWREF